jgi:YggT family protein
MQNALIFLVRTLTDLYILTFLLRFIMQWTRADFHNPFAEVILRVTNPLVLPARRILPAARGVDLPTLILLLVLEALATVLLLALWGVRLPTGTFVLMVVLRLVNLTIWFYTIAVFVYVILSWIGQGRYTPIGAILSDLVEPILSPARRILPSIAGLDLSPLLVLVLLQAVSIALPLEPYLR